MKDEGFMKNATCQSFILVQPYQEVLLTVEEVTRRSFFDEQADNVPVVPAEFKVFGSVPLRYGPSPCILPLAGGTEIRVGIGTYIAGTAAINKPSVFK